MKNDVFEKSKASRGDLDRSWADLESIWGAKRLQNGGRGGSKSEVSSVELSGVKLSEVEVQ